MNQSPARHRLFETLAVAALVLFVASACGATDLLPTPGTGRGPFFPPDAEGPSDNDLRSVDGAEGEPRGVALRIEGTVVDRAGAPLPKVEVILWQVDSGGNYNHPDEASSGPEEGGDGEIDPAFQYWGKTTTAADGTFRFETIVPGHYRVGGITRPNHVHFELRHAAHGRLATEMNFVGDPHFEDDFVTGGLSAEELATLQVELEDDPERPGGQLARWRVVLGR